MINPFSSQFTSTLRASEINLGYDQYNILCFFKTKKSSVYYGVDKGTVCNCSKCAIHQPFHKYSVNNDKKVLRKLKKIKSLKECKKVFNDFVNSKKSMSINTNWDELSSNLKQWGIK